MRTQKIKQLEMRIDALESNLARLSGGQDETGLRFAVKAHFVRVESERMPFTVTFGLSEYGILLTRSLTPVRASILLVLLMDLLERGENGQSKQDTITRVREALLALSGTEEKSSSDEALRVALHRAGQFFEEEFAFAADSQIAFSIDKGILTLLHRGVAISPSKIDVEITSTDQAISSYLDRSLATSPLARLRKSRALFVPPGDEGQDRLVLELLDHDCPVRQTTLFYRPTIQSFPVELLNKLSISGNRKQRQEVALKGYQSGRLHYTEILQRSVLREMIRRVPGKGFSLYPPECTAIDVVQHLDHMMFLVRNMRTYELVLTDAFFPFYINALEVSRPESTERFVLFFQQAEDDNLRRVSVFGLKDDAVYFSAQDRIVRWVLAHPTTIRSREQVLQEIQDFRDDLVKSIENPND